MNSFMSFQFISLRKTFLAKEQVHLVFFLDRPVRLVLESYNLCGIMYSYMPITYMN